MERQPSRAVPTLSWDDVHRLELHLRARSVAIGRRNRDPSCCPGCGREVNEGEGGTQMGGVTVHLGCLPTLGDGAQTV